MPDGRLGWVLLGGGLGGADLTSLARAEDRPRSMANMRSPQGLRELPNSDDEVVNPRKKK